MKYNVISADNHVIEPPGTFVDRLPANLKDRSPRVVPSPTKGGEGWSFDGGPPSQVFSPPNHLLSSGGYRWDQVRPGNYDGAAHIQDMALDGVDAAVIYPLVTRQTYELKDRELAIACMSAYNDWLLEDFCSADPRRLFGICPVPTDDGADVMVAEAKRVVAKGAKGFFLPYYPARPYYDPYYDPLWHVASESGVVASLHHMFGGKRPAERAPIPGVDQGNLRASSTVKSYFSAIDHITDMILTGVFQRFPSLKFMHAEVNVGWAGYWMQQMYLTVNRPTWKGADWYPNMPTLHPEEHIGKNVFFTALDDYLGFKLAREDEQLAAAAMYSTDYEHSITLWPDSAKYIAKLTDGMDENLKYRLLAGNAVRVFNLN